MDIDLHAVRFINLVGVPLILGLAIWEGLLFFPPNSWHSGLVAWAATSLVFSAAIRAAEVRCSFERRPVLKVLLEVPFWPFYGSLYLVRVCRYLDHKWSNPIGDWWCFSCQQWASLTPGGCPDGHTQAEIAYKDL